MDDRPTLPVDAGKEQVSQVDVKIYPAAIFPLIGFEP
jgi:hypothetical protein